MSDILLRIGGQAAQLGKVMKSYKQQYPTPNQKHKAIKCFVASALYHHYFE